MDLDTSMGGNQSRFPETRRSAVVDFNSGDASLRECAAEALISAYWKPVYNLLEGACELLVVNAQHIKAVPGRKVRREVA